MYISTTVSHDKLEKVSHELEEDKIHIWLHNGNGSTHMSLSKKDLIKFKEEILSLTETLRQFYQNEDYVERGIEE